MPVILEEVQPSWIQDGWGIQGDQDEVRFDDDIPWDLIAWTRDHPDESDFNCCRGDCSSITSITFNGVEFCCACIDEFPDDGRIEIFESEEFGSLNDIAWTLPRTGSFGTCSSTVCYNNGFDPPPDNGIFLGYHNTGTSSCPDGSEDPEQLSLTVFVTFNAGMWEVLLAVEGIFIFFYGLSADPSSIPNLVTDCTLSPSEWPNCFDDFAIPVCALAKNGTATLTF